MPPLPGLAAFPIIFRVVLIEVFASVLQSTTLRRTQEIPSRSKKKLLVELHVSNRTIPDWTSFAVNVNKHTFAFEEFRSNLSSVKIVFT